jgi:hypothetical protein
MAQTEEEYQDWICGVGDLLDEEYPYEWYWTEKARPALGDRKGERCKALVWSKPYYWRGKWRGMNSVLVEFVSDGKKVNTSRNAIRKVSRSPYDLPY